MGQVAGQKKKKKRQHMSEVNIKHNCFKILKENVGEFHHDLW